MFEKQQNTPAVRHVRQPVRHPVRHQTRAVAGLCGLCGIRPRVHVTHAQKNTAHKNKTKTAHVYVNHAAHTAHTAQPSVHAGFSCAACVNPYRTYRTKKKELEEKGIHPMEKTETPQAETTNKAPTAAPGAAEVLTCTPDTHQTFQSRLKAQMPEFWQLAAAMHRRGLIDGLRGARIGPIGSLQHPDAVRPQLSLAAEKRLADQQHQAKA